MKKSTLEKYLAAYNDHRGFGRLVKTEPHIKSLQKFNKTLKNERALNPDELQKLAYILLEKQDRSKDTISSRLFCNLANQFGGYEALDLLTANDRQLTDIDIVFLERNRESAVKLAPLMVELYRDVYLQVYKYLIDVSQKVSDKNQVYKTLLFLKGQISNPFFLAALEINQLLNDQGLKTDDFMQELYSLPDYNLLHSIFKILTGWNKELLTLANVRQIFRLKNPSDFIILLQSLLPVTQFQMDCLFSVDNKHSYKDCKDIINHFKKARWDLNTYLIPILHEKQHLMELTKACQRLAEISVRPDSLTKILDAIFNHKQDSLELVEGFLILRNAGFLDDLHVILSVPKYADKMAAGITALRREQMYNSVTISAICDKPEFAPGLALFLVKLNESGCNDAVMLQSILEYPEYAEVTGQLIHFLNEFKLNTRENITIISNAGSVRNNLYELLKVLQKNNLVSQPNLNKLFTRLNQMQTLLTGVIHLDENNRLDQENFDTVILEPQLAVTLEKNIIVTEAPPETPWIARKGFFQDKETESENNKNKKAGVLQKISQCCQKDLNEDDEEIMKQVNSCCNL